MGRPRIPAKILELRGAFKKDPQRAREDIEGAGEFDPHPPAHLPQELVGAWRDVVRQINPILLTASDYDSIECMARLTVQMRLRGDVSAIRELRQWYAQYGMTAVGRTKLSAPKQKPAGNRFQDV